MSSMLLEKHGDDKDQYNTLTCRTLHSLECDRERGGTTCGMRFAHGHLGALEHLNISLKLHSSLAHLLCN